MKYLLIVFCFFTLSGVSFSQSRIFPDLPSDYIHDIYFLENGDIIFTNNGGCIYKSLDNGETWQLKGFFPGHHLVEIHFTDNLNGFIISRNYDPFVQNMLFYTNDGGETWTEFDPDLYIAYSFLPVTENILLKASHTGIQRLSNFFGKWDSVYTIPTFLDSGDDLSVITGYGYIIKLLKKEDGSIIALGNNDNAWTRNIISDSVSYLLQSTDAGASWDTLWIGLKESVLDIVYTDNNNAWMITQSSLYRSDNGGSSWVLVNKFPDESNSYKAVFADSSGIYLLDWSRNLIKSTNEGVTWKTDSLGIYGLYKIIFNNNIGLIIGSALMRSSDYGDSWVNLIPYASNDLIDIDFVSPSRGFIKDNRYIYETADSGRSWSILFDTEDYNGIISNPLTMLNDSTGWCITSSKLLKTTDGGNSWETVVLTNSNLNYYIMEFWNSKTGVLTATDNSKNVIYFTSDAGENWTLRDDDTSYFAHLDFSDPGYLWGTNNNGLWLSRDNAQTWELVYSRDSWYAYYPIDFIDSLFGVYSDGVWGSSFTIDGGKSWQTLERITGSHITDSRVLGKDMFGRYRIIETGEKGLIQYSEIYPDGTITYTRQLNSYTAVTLTQIGLLMINDVPNVWFGGQGFTVISDQYGKVFVNADNKPGIPAAYSLEQNYPNPFNPSTTIEYNLPSRGLVTLKIYDILGKEITTLVNEEQNAGNYKITYNAAALSTGVYFCSLRSGNFSDTKKILFIK